MVNLPLLAANRPSSERMVILNGYTPPRSLKPFSPGLHRNGVLVLPLDDVVT